MSSKTWTWIASLAALAWLGGVAAAAPPERTGGPPHEPGQHGPGPQLERLLGLSAEQKTAFEALQREQHEALRPLLEAQHELGQAFHAALEAKDPDPADVGRKAIAMYAGMQRLKAAHEGLHERLAALLDAGQKEKLKLLEESGALRGGPGMHGFGHGPDGPFGMMGHLPPPPPPDDAQ
jgi:Spy/CpxP family protein refolding chaperone